MPARFASSSAFRKTSQAESNKLRPAKLAEIAAHGFVLTPGRYVGAEDIEDDDGSFAERFPKLLAELEAQFEASSMLANTIRASLGKLVDG